MMMLSMESPGDGLMQNCLLGRYNRSNRQFWQGDEKKLILNLELQVEAGGHDN
jgi:hypothetical protein